MHSQQKVAFILHHETAAKDFFAARPPSMRSSCVIGLESLESCLFCRAILQAAAAAASAVFSWHRLFVFQCFPPNQDLERREREREGRARRSHLENRTYARQISRSEVRLDVLLLASLHKQARFRNAPLSDMDEGGHGVNSFIRDL
jgi:hypothetical protein